MERPPSGGGAAGPVGVLDDPVRGDELVAEMIDTTPAAVNSALQRARAALEGAAFDGGPAASEPVATEVLDRYVDAFARADVGALRTLLVDDVVMEMPPVPLWFQGRGDFVGFLERAFRMRGTDWRAMAVDANGQTALAAYVRAGEGYEAHSIQVLDIADGGVACNVVFFDASLFARFGLPARLDA